MRCIFSIVVASPPCFTSTQLELLLAELKDTKYLKRSTDRDLPHTANCVTAVRYLLRKAYQIALPHVWVGDLPRALSLLEWNIRRVEQLRPGDLIFRGKEPGVITHLAVAINAYEVYHCVWDKGSRIETIRKFLEENRTDLETPNSLTATHDPRPYSLGRGSGPPT